MRDHKVEILVLCSGNSCRSQIAAAYLERYGGHRLQVFSAGTAPDEDIHPLTRLVLAEDGIDLGDRTPTDYRSYLGRISPYFLVVVCDRAAATCPTVWPGVMEHLDWPFEDPARVTGSYHARLDGFRRVRDQIRSHVEAWVDQRLTEPATGPRA